MAVGNIRSTVLVYNDYMIRFFLVRHGETQFNIAKMVQGWNDSPLTEKGEYQASCTGKGLKDVAFVRAYSGDAGRQFQTGDRKPVVIIPDMHFREMRYGGYECGTYENMLGPLYALNGETYGDGFSGLYRFYNDIEISELLMERDETGSFEGHLETFERFYEGMRNIIDEIDEGNVLIATSGFSICSVLHHLFSDIKIVDNASVTVIGYDGDFHLLDCNDITYRQAGEAFYCQNGE